MAHTEHVGVDRRTCVESFSLCEKGNVRNTNEDSIAVVDGLQFGHPQKGTLLIVADGLGGMSDGEHASKYVTSELPALYFAHSEQQPASALVSCLHEVNKRMYELRSESVGGKKWGSTVVAALIVDSRVFVANLGDSRAYLFHDQRLRQLTVDHTLADPVFFPFVTRSSRLSHVLTQALGPSPTVSPFISTTELSEGDLLLLCSDGLSSVLSDAEIAQIIASQPPENAVRTLRDRVYEKGGEDNISLILSRLLTVP